METISELIGRARKVEHGFKEIEREAENLAGKCSVEDCLSISKKLLSSEVYQARCLATFVLGLIASKSSEAFDLLRRNIAKDESWQVQEILAKSFDRYCSDIDYEKALPVIENWLKDENQNVRRAVTEGLRIWTNRAYFKDNPNVAIKLLSQLKRDESEYVRKSVGNALKDISKKHKELIRSELQTWDISDKRTRQTHKLASKFLDPKELT